MLNKLKLWLKTSPSPWARRLFVLAKAVRRFEFPVIPLVHRLIYLLHHVSISALRELKRILYDSPLTRSRFAKSGKRFYLYGGIPQIIGDHLRIELGDDVRMSGQLTINARTETPNPSLIIGSNVDVGWLSGISVGTRIVLEDDVRMGGRNSLFGYSGHSLDPVLRAQGAPDDESQIGDIILEKGVWLGTGAVVTANVRIGAGTVVGANSVVTKDLPPNVIAGGVPAKVIRALPVKTPVNNASDHE